MQPAREKSATELNIWRGWQFIVPLREIGIKILPFHIYENTVLESLLWHFAMFKQEVRITHCTQQKILVFPHKR